MNRATLLTWDDSQPERLMLPFDMVFVFGSNKRGRHGKGAADTALKCFGAIEGIAEGYAGQSYAIPTKDEKLWRLDINQITGNITRFCEFAELHDFLKFFITPVGCGYAGYSPRDIAPLFSRAPRNCVLPVSWRSYFPGATIINVNV